MGKYCDGEKVNLEILKDVHVLSPSECEKVVSDMPSVFLSVCVWMCASLAPEMLVRFHSYLVFKTLCIIVRCPVNMNIPGSNTWARQLGPKTQNGIFSKLVVTILIKFQ
jgi:hypothetical protein